MERQGIYFFLLLMHLLSGCEPEITVNHLKVFAPTENYPYDTFLDSVTNKRALIIVAHDDDDCAMSGTIAKLTRRGWDIKQLSLQNHILSQTGKNPADIICLGNELILDDGYYRIGLDTMKAPYLPIPYNKIDEQFLTEKVATQIINNIEAFKPSVVFTLDNEKGGYGHPEHIFISQLVKNLYEERKINIQKIYQSVYTDHMENEIVDKWLDQKMKNWGHPNLSTVANDLYGINGMPEPSVQIDIKEVAEIKMKYLKAYDEDVRKNLRKFIPYYEEFDAKDYFEIFDREFFRIVDHQNDDIL